MPIAAIIGLAVEILDVIANRTNKYPAEADALASVTPKLLAIVSMAAQETPDQTAARLSTHDALIAKYANPPSTALHA